MIPRLRYLFRYTWQLNNPRTFQFRVWHWNIIIEDKR